MTNRFKMTCPIHGLQVFGRIEMMQAWVCPVYDVLGRRCRYFAPDELMTPDGGDVVDLVTYLDPLGLKNFLQENP